MAIAYLIAERIARACKDVALSLGYPTPERRAEERDGQVCARRRRSYCSSDRVWSHLSKVAYTSPGIPGRHSILYVPGIPGRTFHPICPWDPWKDFPSYMSLGSQAGLSIL